MDAHPHSPRPSSPPQIEHRGAQPDEEKGHSVTSAIYLSKKVIGQMI